MTTFSPVMKAAIDLLGRTGAQSMQFRYSDDEEPTVWFCVASYLDKGKSAWETASGHDVEQALLRLCERLVDGGLCNSCGKPTTFDEDWQAPLLSPLLCAYKFDPELVTFRRSCEGSVDHRPHSRACGIRAHAHGPLCSPNCPTCHGRAS